VDVQLPRHANDPVDDLNWFTGTKTLIGVRRLVIDVPEELFVGEVAKRWYRKERRQTLLLWFEHERPYKFMERPWDQKSCAQVSRMVELQAEPETFIQKLDPPRVVEVRHQPRTFLDAADPFKMHEIESPGVLYLLDERTNLVICEVGTTVEDAVCFVAEWNPTGYTPRWLEGR